MAPPAWALWTSLLLLLLELQQSSARRQEPLVVEQEPLVVEPGKYDDPVLQDAPTHGIYPDHDDESSGRFVKTAVHSCDAYADQCRLAQKEICKWYGYPGENATCTNAIKEHVAECESAVDTWRDLKKEARKDVYKEINVGYGTHLPAAATLLEQHKQLQHGLRSGRAAASGLRGRAATGRKKTSSQKREKLRYSPRTKKHFEGLCQSCRSAGDLPRDDPGHVRYADIREICLCSQEYGFVAGMHERAKNMACDADE